MIDSFIKKLKIPNNCKLNKPVFKKLFLENGSLDATDKKALKDDISKIRWLYTLKQSTINIAPYHDESREYLEVAILQIDLSKPERIKRIAGFIQKTIPYPLVVIFTHENKFCLNLADKRINQADKTKLVLLDIWTTSWIDLENPTKAQVDFMDACAINNLSFTNFYAFYEDIKLRVIALNAGTHKNIFELGSKERNENRSKDLRAIEDLEREVAELRSRLKKESQFNHKLDLNIEIKKRIENIARLQEQL